MKSTFVLGYVNWWLVSTPNGREPHFLGRENHLPKMPGPKVKAAHQSELKVTPAFSICLKTSNEMKKRQKTCAIAGR